MRGNDGFPLLESFASDEGHFASRPRASARHERTSDVCKGEAELMLLEEDGAPGQVEGQLRRVQRQRDKAAALAPHLHQLPA